MNKMQQNSVPSDYNSNYNNYKNRNQNETNYDLRKSNNLSYSTNSKIRPHSVNNYSNKSNNSRKLSAIGGRQKYNENSQDNHNPQQDYDNINAEYYQAQIDKLTKKYGNLDDIDEEQLRNFIQENFQNEQMLLTKENDGYEPPQNNQNFNNNINQNYIEHTVGEEIPNIQNINEENYEEENFEGNVNEMDNRKQDDIEINNEDIGEDEMYNENFDD